MQARDGSQIARHKAYATLRLTTDRVCIQEFAGRFTIMNKASLTLQAKSDVLSRKFLCIFM
jgi:hypothetical protein